MIAIIRISGMVGVNEDVENTLLRLRLRRKYSCVILRESKELSGMLNKIRSFVAYGEIDKETFVELAEKRGELIDKNKKTDKKGAGEQYFSGKKKLQDYNLKPFFRLHPPRKGINSKKHYPVGVLGSHGKEINNLIKRMLWKERKLWNLKKEKNLQELGEQEH